jgi:DNA-binding protein HU-beta
MPLAGLAGQDIEHDVAADRAAGHRPSWSQYLVETHDYVDTVFSLIGDAAAKREEIAINAFGKFSVKRTPARDGRNPRTGEPMTIKAATKVSFKRAKALKDKVNR